MTIYHTLPISKSSAHVFVCVMANCVEKPQKALILEVKFWIEGIILVGHTNLCGDRAPATARHVKK